MGLFSDVQNLAFNRNDPKKKEEIESAKETFALGGRKLKGALTGVPEPFMPGSTTARPNALPTNVATGSTGGSLYQAGPESPGYNAQTANIASKYNTPEYAGKVAIAEQSVKDNYLGEDYKTAMGFLGKFQSGNVPALPGYKLKEGIEPYTKQKDGIVTGVTKAGMEYFRSPAGQQAYKEHKEAIQGQREGQEGVLPTDYYTPNDSTKTSFPDRGGLYGVTDRTVQDSPTLNNNAYTRAGQGMSEVINIMRESLPQDKFMDALMGTQYRYGGDAGGRKKLVAGYSGGAIKEMIRLAQGLEVRGKTNEAMAARDLANQLIAETEVAGKKEVAEIGAEKTSGSDKQHLSDLDAYLGSITADKRKDLRAKAMQAEGLDPFDLTTPPSSESWAKAVAEDPEYKAFRTSRGGGVLPEETSGAGRGTKRSQNIGGHDIDYYDGDDTYRDPETGEIIGYGDELGASIESVKKEVKSYYDRQKEGREE